METIFPVISHTVTPSLTILQRLLYCRKPSTPCTKLVQIYFCKGWRYSYLSTHSVEPRKGIQISQISWARFFFPFIFISWRLITLQYCSGFCHMLTWISHGFTCIPHPNPPSHLPLHPIPLGLPSAPATSTRLMHPIWAGNLFHPW